MSLFASLLTIGGAIIGFFLLVDGLSYIVANSGGRGASRAERRLNLSNTLGEKEQVELIASGEGLTAKTAIGRFYERLIQRAALGVKPHQVMFISIFLSLASFLAMAIILQYAPIWILAIAAAVVGAAAPIFYLQGKAAERVKKFQEQFPDALDLIVRSLRIGHPLSVALATIAKEVADPLGGEFNIAARQVTFGKSTPEAVNALARRVNMADVRFFAVAVQIHHESGGNLAEILNGLSTVIRGRFQLFRKVSALTVEGRFSAWFLSLFPVVMIFVMGAMQPGYYEKASDFAFFPHLVVLTFFLLFVNVIAMRMITKLEV